MRASTWANTDWATFRKWAETLPDKTKEDMLFRGFEKLGQNTPEMAATELKKIPRNIRNQMTISVIQGINETEKGEGRAFDWLMVNREFFDENPELMRLAVSDYYSQSPQFTRKILEMQEGTVKDAAMVELLHTLSTNLAYKRHSENTPEMNFPGIIALTEKISDPNIRTNSTIDCLSDWISSDPQAAKQWIRKNPSFSEEQKDSFFQQIDEQKKENMKYLPWSLH